MKTKTKFYWKAVAALLCVVLAVLCLPRSSYTGRAESGGTVTVHFYNSEGYGCDGAHIWGAYYWITRANTVAASGADEAFANPNRPDNVAQTFTLMFTAGEVELLKSGSQLGLIMVWVTEQGDRLTPNWGKKDVQSDRMINIDLDADNNGHIYVIAGDKTNYPTLALAKTAFERIESAVFDTYGDIAFQTTGTLTAETKARLYKTTFVDGATVREPVAEGMTMAASGRKGRISVPGLSEASFDMHAFYELSVDGYAYSVPVDKTRLYISPHFKAEYQPAIDQGGSRVEYGAIYSAEKTVFRVWAPVSYRVRINFYRSGDPKDDSIARNPVDMTLKAKGVFEAEAEGDLHGVYYTYSYYTDDQIVESIDIWAKACGINGDRGMVVDLDATDPDGWDADLVKANAIRTKQATAPEPVIWEVHVRDFSIHPDSGMKYKGKYLAFTEQGTTLKGDGTVKTGLNYLKDLGVTYVHLQPVFDFAKVDESRMNDPSYDGKYNWGYDPKNYNIPDGSYSTDPYEGTTRINEFKQMVKALHDAGIGVIMDVVYNHTFNLLAPINKAVPGYYYRQAVQWSNGQRVPGSFDFPAYVTDNLGNYVYSDGSDCGNETASEREMFGQYMRNSVLYWAEEYHIDGFRFDLMGLHNVGTMNAIRTDLDNAFGGAGRGILVYGEPWAAFSGSTLVEDGTVENKKSDKSNFGLLKANIKGFNDDVRDGIRGKNGDDNKDGYLDEGGGFAGGNKDKAGALLFGVTGGVFGLNAVDKAVTYAAAHDNYTLNDQLLASTMHYDKRTDAVYTMGNATVESMNRMIATFTLTSKGTPFLLAGEEYMRTKYGNHNSYDSGDKVNAIDYARVKVKSNVYDYYKGLIALRKCYSPFRDETGNAAMSTANYDNGGVIRYMYTSGSKTGDRFRKVAVILNPFDAAFICIDTNMNGFKLIGDGYTIDLNATKTVTAGFTVPGKSAVILAI